MDNKNKSNLESALIAEKMAMNASSPMTQSTAIGSDHKHLIDKEIDLSPYQIAKKILPTYPDLIDIRQKLSSDKPEDKSNRLNIIFGAGKSMHQRIRAIPIIGYALAWCNAFIKLPATRNHHLVEIQALRQQNDLLFHNVQILNDKITYLQAENVQVIEESNVSSQRVAHQLESLKQHVVQRLVSIEEAKLIRRMHEVDMLDIGRRLMKIEQMEMPRKLKQFAHLMQIFQEEVLENKRQNSSIHESSQLEIKQSATSLKSTNENDFDSHQFYLDFEEKFRGDKLEIKDRLKAYLPYISNIKALKEDQRPTFIDVGCGRGEWLSLMMEQGIPAIGIDLNTSMVNACLASGYAAKVADAIEFLQEQEEGSLGGVTGFHIIEHLPFETLIALFDAAYKALKKGGIVIFETPNPENLIVGACNFYFDPTHLHPIVPMVAEFMAKQRGFEHTEILRLHPYPENHRMTGNTDADKILNKYFFDAQDYALIARK
jgi:2-polyprenyl-3-methyl-5-hydroxy-6-metoxy-1,4-benzoquinol methylase